MTEPGTAMAVPRPGCAGGETLALVIRALAVRSATTLREVARK